MTKEYSWVPVLNDNEDQYIPGRYLKEDIYTGENCLPQFDTKEECELWCENQIISEIIKLETIVTESIFNGHKANDADEYADKRKRLVFLRQILKDRGSIHNKQ
jgi:hypothetical protein